MNIHEEFFVKNLIVPLVLIFCSDYLKRAGSCSIQRQIQTNYTYIQIYTDGRT